jgi:uncharacterized protein
MARLNFEVPMELTHALLPTLQSRRGAVLNIASLAAFMPLPNLSVVGASKAALLHWSVALRRELMGAVSVTAFCPGITKTPFLRAAKMDHLRLDERFFASEPAVVASRALDAVANNRAVAFATTLDTVSATIASFVPRRLAAALAHSILKPSR